MGGMIRINDFAKHHHHPTASEAVVTEAAMEAVEMEKEVREVEAMGGVDKAVVVKEEVAATTALRTPESESYGMLAKTAVQHHRWLPHPFQEPPLPLAPPFLPPPSPPPPVRTVGAKFYEPVRVRLFIYPDDASGVQMAQYTNIRHDKELFETKLPILLRQSDGEHGLQIVNDPRMADILYHPACLVRAHRCRHSH